MLSKFYDFLGQPIFLKARLALCALVLPLALSFTAPLWKISMEAPQYPEGLSMLIYSYKLDGGNDGQHIQEINTLNHYIGMRPIDRRSLSDLDWIPFLFGGLILLTLRVAAIGSVREAVDLMVLSGYACCFALGRFVYQLYSFGHDLDPKAPVKVEPFTPVLLGTKQIANFTTHSYPQLGTIYVGLFLLGLGALLLWHFISGRRRAAREGSARFAADLAGGANLAPPAPAVGQT